ncbi:MAG: hypothetical protein ACOYIR_08355 [Christensenellales bacterium]|jgi:hypothetical protein
MKLWGMLKKKQKILASQVAEVEPNVQLEDEEWLHDAIGEICTALDIARPVILKKHAQDFNRFSRVVFKKDDFMEKTGFDQFEVELIDQEKKNRGSKTASDD